MAATVEADTALASLEVRDMPLLCSTSLREIPA